MAGRLQLSDIKDKYKKRIDLSYKSIKISEKRIFWDFGKEERRKSLEEKLEKYLKEYSISCLENIVPVGESADDGITEIKKDIVANLTEAFKKQTDVQLKSKIAQALRKIDDENCIYYSLSSLHDPDLCEKERNEVWMDIIGQWKQNNISTDIDSLCNAMRAMLKYQTSTNVRQILENLFRSRVLIVD